MALKIGHTEDTQTTGVHQGIVVAVADPEQPHVEETVVGVVLVLNLQPVPRFEESVGRAGIQRDGVGEFHQGRGEGAEQPQSVLEGQGAGQEFEGGQGVTAPGQYVLDVGEVPALLERCLVGGKVGGVFGRGEEGLCRDP